MKTLIATSIILLASGSAHAFDLSKFNSQEFYSGQENSHNILINPAIAADNEHLFRDGVFPKVSPGLSNPDDRGLADVEFPTELYLDGQWPS